MKRRPQRAGDLFVRMPRGVQAVGEEARRLDRERRRREFKERVLIGGKPDAK